MRDAITLAKWHLLNHNNVMKTPISGVYKITSPAGNVYVGSSRDLKRRKNDRSKPSFARKARVGRLSASLREHGWQAHAFEVLEECPPEMLLIRERHWQEALDACGPKGLNSTLVGTPDKPAQISEEARARMCAAQGGPRNPNYGKRGPETSTWGRQRNPEERAAILAYQRQRGRLIQQIDPASGAVAREARAWEYRAEGWSQGNISSCCTGRLKTYRGFRFQYKKDEHAVPEIHPRP
jgi:group I intron endonuclease